MKFIKVLHVIDCMRIGGAQRRLFQLLKGLRDEKRIQNYLVVFSDEIDFPGLKNLNVQIFVIDTKKYISYESFIKLKKIIRDIGPDIVHSWQLIASFYATVLSVGSRFKHLNAMINDSTARKFFNKERILAKSIIPFANVLVSNSKAGLTAYKVRQKKNVFVVYNGFDFERLSNSDNTGSPYLFKDELDDSIIIGMVARFEKAKDHATVIQAICLLLERQIKVKFVAVGDGDTVDRCKGLIPEKYKNAFLFLGKRDNIDALVPGFDIGVLSTYTEGISNAIMEYMAFKKPVVATKCPGNEELIVDGQTGVLAKTQDISDWVNKLSDLTENSGLRHTYGENGYQRLFDQFPLNKMIGRYLELYSHLSTSH